MSGDTRGGLGSSYSREGKRKGWGDFLEGGGTGQGTTGEQSANPGRERKWQSRKEVGLGLLKQGGREACWWPAVMRSPAGGYAKAREVCAGVNKEHW